MKLSKMLANVVIENGFSWNLREDNSPTSGYAVSCSKDTERVFENCPTQLEIAEFIIDNAAALLQDSEETTVVGLWEDSGKWYLDVSSIFHNKEVALKCGRLADQIAIFDIANLETIYTN